MASQEHLDRLLTSATSDWNKWKRRNPDILIDLTHADLSQFDLHEGGDIHNVTLDQGASRDGSTIDLSNADLRGANLSHAHLYGANLTGTDLSRASLTQANLIAVDLSRACLFKADLFGADLIQACLADANLRGADLSFANLSYTILDRADLTGCHVHGASIWNVSLDKTIQKNLIITTEYESTITVDNLEVAQFIYLLLNNKKIRDVIDTITSKVVLILGRFTPERHAILDTIRETLRQKGYLPILFDFDKPQSQDLTETVSTLAHLAKFVIVDLTDPSSAPHEVMAIAPHCIVPIQPLFHPDGRTKHEYAMFRDLQQRFHWVLPTHHYQDLEGLLASLQSKVIAPAERKAHELGKQR